ncbi:MAG TPA: S49 family peptidase, partial [candidate division Zixibacteria bacterium]|nr:S49 family peptidase [candidate division Zixibacteria bacterium]
QFVKGIAEGRHITADSVKTIINNGPFTSEEALSDGLVDGLSYYDELRDSLVQPMREIPVSLYVDDTLVNDSWKQVPTIAVVVADGEVSEENSSFSLLAGQSYVTPSKMKMAFAQAMTTPNVAGVVFRVNSPGGLALAGDKIFHDAGKVTEELPFVVSMSNIAASGGYYISMTADRIYANPATLTGSIGIFGGKADFSGFYKKIDLGKELFTRGKYAGMLSTMRPFTEDERDKYFSQLSAMYGHFVDLVSSNRNLPVDSVDNLGQGEEWTGREALVNGLVDSLGGIRESIAFTAHEIGASDYRVRLFPEKRPLFDLPGHSLVNLVASVFARNHSAASLADRIDLDGFEGMFTRVPYDLSIQ